MAHPLSDIECLKIINTNCNVVTYHKCRKYKNIEELFTSGRCLILVEINKRNTGHWIALSLKNNKISYFDSYGYNLIKTISHVKLRDLPHLEKLLLQFQGTIEYNNDKFQHGNTVTCGYYASLWLRNSQRMSLQVFENSLKELKHIENKPYDILITKLCDKFLT